MPPVMMTWVTPTAMMPTTETCRMMMLRRCGLSMKLSPWTTQPSSSKIDRYGDQAEKDVELRRHGAPRRGCRRVRPLRRMSP